MRTPELLLSRLANVRPCGSYRWTARCPAHPDRNPSLSIKQAVDRILLHCWAGCSAHDIIRAIGLTLADLYNDSAHAKPDPVVDRRRLAAKGLEIWRQAQLQLCAEELRARDTPRGAITRMVQAGEMTEEAAWVSLEDVYRGYSELEYKFERLLHGEGVLALWRESRRGDA